MKNEISELEDAELRVVGLNQAPTAALAVQAMAAMVDKRITTAKNWPRSIAQFKARTSDLLKNDIDTARSAEYAKPVGGGSVKGPSVRLAELVAMCWKNLEIEVNDPIIADKTVTVKACAWDLENNYRQEAIAVTSITDKNGNRYKNSMIETACLATASKAKRNAIFSIIPRAYVNDLLEVAKTVANANEKPLEQRRKDAIEFFARTHKVSSEQIFATLGIEGEDDMTTDHLDELRSIITALKEGEAKPEDFFNLKTESKADSIKQKLSERKKKSDSLPGLEGGQSQDASKL